MLLLLGLVLLMACLARLAGDGALGGIPEMLFGVVFGIACGWPWGILGAVNSYIAMETGHGTAFQMGYKPQDALTGRKQRLSFIIDPLCKLFHQELGGKFYCWSFMGLKGLWIGLPVLGWELAILWPLSYFVARWAFYNGLIGLKTSGWACELLSGACAGLVIWYNKGLGV